MKATRVRTADQLRRTDAAAALQGGLWETEGSQNTFTDGQGNKYWLIDTTGGNVSVALPAATDASPDTIFNVKRTTGGANTLTVTPDSGNIDGSAAHSIATQYAAFGYASDGTNYHIVRQYSPGEYITSASLTSALAPYITSASVSAALAANSIIGEIRIYAGTSAPSLWLLCYGQAISRTTYASLFTVLSTTYGAGDGTTTFNIPDIRGRVVAGQDDMGGTSANRLTSPINGDTLGATGGSESHTLTTAEIPAHTHGIGNRVSSTDGNQLGGGVRARSVSGTTSDSTGGDGAHNNVQPTIILNYIIFAGV